MRITKTFVSVFLFTFFIGYVFVPTTKKQKEISFETATKLIKESPAPVEIKNAPETIEENIDWQEEDESKFKIKLLETGEGFHGDQVQAKSGEIWLGLFKQKDKFFLRSTKLKIRRVHDVVVDGEDENVKTGKSVFTNVNAQAVFLLKNAKMLREGEIKTLYFAADIDENTELRNGSQKNFEFNGDKYTLRVENKISSDEFLGKGSKLILSRNGTEQILNYLKDGCDDCFWNLYWVGDLDRDGKLDFYFDLSWHYNVMDKRLFLSSQADKGKMIKNIANFWTNGC